MLIGSTKLSQEEKKLSVWYNSNADNPWCVRFFLLKRHVTISVRYMYQYCTCNANANQAIN